MSIRLRLTLLYSSILAITLIALSAALYAWSTSQAHKLVKEQLYAEARVLTAAKEYRLDRILLPASNVTKHGTLIQIRDRSGNVTDHYPFEAEFTLPLDETSAAAVRHGKESIAPAVVNGEPLLVFSKLIGVPGQPNGVLQIARSLEAQERAAQTLRTSLIVGSIVVIVIAFGMGWMLAGTALRPIKRITQTAQAIGAERNFDRRVEHTGPQDELAQLTTTFNTMLTELQAAYRQVEQALQAQRRFVADASHELRTPLTTIRGNVALLQRDPPINPADRVGALADMADETDRLIRLVNDLLVLARADAGRQLRKEPVPIKPMIEELCRSARRLAPDRRITCDDLPDQAVVGSADAIKQVLLILIDNALKFTPRDGLVAIGMRVSREHVAVYVRDTGPGIPPQTLPHIFERFYRGDGSRTGGGAGLGLAIARTLVEAQQGTLAVESVVGHGSTFTMTLPRAAAFRTHQPVAELVERAG